MGLHWISLQYPPFDRYESYKEPLTSSWYVRKLEFSGYGCFLIGCKYTVKSHFFGDELAHASYFENGSQNYLVFTRRADFEAHGAFFIVYLRANVIFIIEIFGVVVFRKFSSLYTGHN